MNNEEIIAKVDADCSPVVGEVILKFSEIVAYLDLARADEREKFKAEIPPVGSGPWATMQHWAGKDVEFAGRTWKVDEVIAGVCKDNKPSAALLACESGWSVFPDEPKPMTFAEGDKMLFQGMHCVLRDGQWYPC